MAVNKLGRKASEETNTTDISILVSSGLQNVGKSTSVFKAPSLRYLVMEALAKY